jgi:hypothetical protein
MHRYLIKAAAILAAGLSFSAMNASASVSIRQHASGCTPFKTSTNGSALTNLHMTSVGLKNVGGSSIQVICPIPNGDRYGSSIGMQVRFLGSGSARTYTAKGSTDVVLGDSKSVSGVPITSPAGVSLSIPPMGLQSPGGVLVTIPGGSTLIGVIFVFSG